MKDLDIVEVSRRTGVPASTLRYYEEKGLIASIGRRGLRRLIPVNPWCLAAPIRTRIGAPVLPRMDTSPMTARAAWRLMPWTMTVFRRALSPLTSAIRAWATPRHSAR